MDSYQQLPNQPQTNPAILDQKVQSSYRIKEIDTNLERGCMFYYGICAKLLGAGSAFGLLGSVLFILFVFGMNGTIEKHYPVFGPPIFFILFIYQKFVEASAIDIKDLEKAKKAVKLILWLSGFALALISVFLAKSEIFDDSYHSDQDLMLFLFFGAPPILAMVISVIGSFKVRALLQEREDLMQKVSLNGCNFA